MPKFTVEVAGVDEAAWERAAVLLPARFPEIEPLGRTAGHPGRERWSCRAPAASHVRRWCAEAAIALVDVRETIDDAAAP